MAGPSVYGAITAVTGELAHFGIPKSHVNPIDDYRYRSIDDVLVALSPLLPKHRLCVLPKVLDRTVTERSGADGLMLINVALRVAFDLVSPEDGSSHRVEAFGEALDAGDKATAKAMSAAYKSAMLQTFCIPVVTNEDSDATSHKLLGKAHVPEPVQGWEQWTLDIGDILGVCESIQAIDLVQERNRDLLKALSRERPDLYTELGCVFTLRRGSLLDRQQQSVTRRSGTRGSKAGRKNEALLEVQNG
jgi:hypothetical protein